MTPQPEFFPPKSRVLTGALVILIAAGLGFGEWYSTNGPIETLHQLQQHRTPGDSAAYVSAVYHASHAQEAEANRWGPTGYATLVTVGTLAGLGLILSARRRRRV